MCGIAGIINHNSTSELSKSLYNMTNSLIRRGPDDEGYALFDTKGTLFSGNDSISKSEPHILNSVENQYQLGLGFRQLKIVDLSNNSHQPMTDQSKNYWIIFNGEIYNFKEIRKELEQLGYSFRSDSDTEVLLKSYIEWGAKALDKLNGMFAFAVYNISKNELFIARDRIGMKPLYYYNDAHVFLFASTTTSIIKSGLYKKNIDEIGLWENYRFSMAQSPNSCFENIKSLKPGHYLKLNLNTKKHTTHKYWEIPVGTQDFSLDEKKSKQLLEEALNKSISYRLNADVEVGSFMSGGIDSTTISVLASKFQPDIKTLTLSFKEFEEYNELQQAKDTAELNNMRHITSSTHAKEVIDKIEQTTLSYAEPYHTLSSNSVISNMAKKNNLKVVLNGLGGDELFGGYDVYKKLQYWQKFKKNKSLINLIPSIHPKINIGKKIAGYNTIDEFYNHYYSLFSDSDLNKLFPDNSLKTDKNLFNKYNEGNINFTDNFDALNFYNLKSYIGNHQMRSVDSATMHYSIEGRFPMLDHNFIETAFKIPTKHKFKNNEPKYILREIAKKHIAPSCMSMNKKGLGLPLKYWIHNELKEFVLDNIHSLKQRNIFNNVEIDTIVASNSTLKIWQLVSTELWLNKFF